MKWMKWFPLRYIISKASHSQGFLDPIELMARLRSFAQPSEVGEPVELLRAGAIFHARGLINSKVIQYNLDWVWPYWVERQFNPRDASFIPRAFSFSHINLTHRNWTAVGYPDCDELPVVDPRGLLTPFLDGWSLDAWIMHSDGRALIPSRNASASQKQQFLRGPSITTRTSENGLTLTNTAKVELQEGRPICKLRLEAEADGRGEAWLVLALRPQNAEGISFVQDLSLTPDKKSWRINETHRVIFDTPAERHHTSIYTDGDVFIDLLKRAEASSASCDVGLTTAAALFPLCGTTAVEASIPLLPLDDKSVSKADAWIREEENRCRLKCPDKQYQFLFDAAVTSLVLHSPRDVYPGPYTYKRFWFRDAAFIIHALLCLNMEARASRAIAQFPHRQTSLGYFRSQEGEWDANGEVLWILQRYRQLTGKDLPAYWDSHIQRGARWIMRKRLDDDLDAPHAGLLPAGFSAEHLGPNDYYYWDDFWCIAGLRAAVDMTRNKDPVTAATFDADADAFQASVDKSLATCAVRLNRPGMPASPYRRLDAGAIGSIAVGYPLQACAPDDPRLLDCVEFLIENCFIDGAFFQDMIHSGLNAYLTLQVAQVLLRAGDSRFLELMDTVVGLATSTGQWPEAIHPRIKGGCMGDGHHVWASAEWVLMLRNCFVREEGEELVVCAGLPQRWLEQEEEISFGPAPTSFGDVSISIQPSADGSAVVRWQGAWHEKAPVIQVSLAGRELLEADKNHARFVLASEVENA